MMRASTASETALPPIERPWRQAFLLLWHDKFALVAAIWLGLGGLLGGCTMDTTQQRTGTECSSAAANCGNEGKNP